MTRLERNIIRGHLTRPWADRSCETAVVFPAYGSVRSERTPPARRRPVNSKGRTTNPKLTWQVGPRWRLIGKYSGDPAEITNQNASQFIAEEATESEAGRRSLAFELDAVLSDSLMWNTVAGTTTVDRSIADVR